MEPQETLREQESEHWEIFLTLPGDAAEFGLGLRLATDKLPEQARDLVPRLRAQIDPDLADALLGADQSSEAGIASQRARVEILRARLAQIDSPESRRLAPTAAYLPRK